MIHTLVIGAGPAGLAVAGRLRQVGLEFEIIEQTKQVAAAWHNHYDRLHLHTVKQLSHLPGLPFPDDYPRYVPRLALIDYYDGYAHGFGIEPRFEVAARSIGKEDGGWKVEVENDSPILAQNVVVATGSNRVPVRPEFQGEEVFEGTILHSRDYRNPVSFAGKRALVVGMGNTGAEIALDLSEHRVDTTISVRGPVNIVPRDVLGRPTQLTARMLVKLPRPVADWLGTLLRRVTVGDLSNYGIETPDLPPLAQLRVQGKTPVIDIGTVRRIKNRRIAVAPGIDHLTTDGVVFGDGQEQKFDVVVLATGYRPVLENLLPDTSALDDQGYPISPIGRGSNDGLFFVGFDNHNPGGILGTIVDESETVVEKIRNRG